ncbi:hypothetical protein B0H63DRAFT_463073 [Podospora didyma]|uniref:Uncharacterized protein n=1 Tax=Podospora didyma TaxID=330526 RepID=A0AAE0NWK5_9PEZI|nr:hypothetical protein B0H63DRAFT_463073 [Podospora didyma]
MALVRDTARRLLREGTPVGILRKKMHLNLQTKYEAGERPDATPTPKPRIAAPAKDQKKTKKVVHFRQPDTPEKLVDLVAPGPSFVPTPHPLKVAGAPNPSAAAVAKSGQIPESANAVASLEGLDFERVSISTTNLTADQNVSPPPSKQDPIPPTSKLDAFPPASKHGLLPAATPPKRILPSVESDITDGKLDTPHTANETFVSTTPNYSPPSIIITEAGFFSLPSESITDVPQRRQRPRLKVCDLNGLGTPKKPQVSDLMLARPTGRRVSGKKMTFHEMMEREQKRKEVANIEFQKEQLREAGYDEEYVESVVAGTLFRKEQSHTEEAEDDPEVPLPTTGLGARYVGTPCLTSSRGFGFSRGVSRLTATLSPIKDCMLFSGGSDKDKSNQAITAIKTRIGAGGLFSGYTNHSYSNGTSDGDGDSDASGQGDGNGDDEDFDPRRSFGRFATAASSIMDVTDVCNTTVKSVGKGWSQFLDGTAKKVDEDELLEMSGEILSYIGERFLIVGLMILMTLPMLVVVVYKVIKWVVVKVWEMTRRESEHDDRGYEYD